MSPELLLFIAALHRVLRTDDDPRSFREWFRERATERGFIISQPTFSRWEADGFPNKRKQALFELVVRDLFTEAHDRLTADLSDLVDGFHSAVGAP